MADGLTVFRPATSDEKKDFVPIGTTSALNKFLKKLAIKQEEYTEKHRPFDGYSARIDFENEVKKYVSESSLATSDTPIEEFNIDKINLDKYGDASRFDLVKVLPVKERQLVGITHKEVVVGKRYDFKSKIRGNGISVFVSDEDVPEMEKWLAKNKFPGYTIRNETTKGKEVNDSTK